VKKGVIFAPTENRALVLRLFISQRSHYTHPPHPQFSPHKHKSCLNICLQSASQQRPRDQQLPRQLLVHKIRPSSLTRRRLSEIVFAVFFTSCHEIPGSTSSHTMSTATSFKNFYSRNILSADCAQDVFWHNTQTQTHTHTILLFDDRASCNGSW